MSKANSLDRLPIASDVAVATSNLKYAPASFGLAALIALALHGAPACAEEPARTQSVEIYGGELFCDGLTYAPVSARNPPLYDNTRAGARYNHRFTDILGNHLYACHIPN